MTHRSRLHSLIWTGVLALVGGICFVLMLQVTAIRSDIVEADRAILSTQQEIASLETEFQTRARQQQLARWNDVDFGYVAPDASQFYEDRTELAALGKPAAIDEGTVMLADAGDASAMRGAPTEGSFRVAAASAAAPAPAMMRQLVAQDKPAARKADKPTPSTGSDFARAAARTEAKPAREPVRVAALATEPGAPRALSNFERKAIAERLAPVPVRAEPKPASAAQFAEKFDFAGVVASKANAND